MRPVRRRHRDDGGAGPVWFWPEDAGQCWPDSRAACGILSYTAGRHGQVCGSGDLQHRYQSGEQLEQLCAAGEQSEDFLKFILYRTVATAARRSRNP